ENPNHLNEPNEDIPEENPVIPEPNHVENAYDPNEIVDIPDDEELVDYDGNDEEKPEEEPEEEPEKEPELNNGHGNQFAQHPNPQPGNMNGWLEEDDDMNVDVEIEVDDDAELIFPYEVEGDQTPPPRDESFDFEPPNAESSDSVSSDSESEDEEIEVAPEVDVAPEATVGTSTQKPYAIRDFPRGLYEVGESSSSRDSSYVGGLAPWALRRDLDATRARDRLTEAELGTCQAKIALLKSKNTIGEKERELLDHDLGDVERTLGNVLERLKRDIFERGLHESRVWNKMFYLDMVRIGAVPKSPCDDEDTEHPRKKSKNSTSDGTEGPFEPHGPPIGLVFWELYNIRWIMLPKAMSKARMREIIRDQVITSMNEFMANMNCGASGAGADGAGADGAGADGARISGAGPVEAEVTGCTYMTFM
ncbi:hypothetical protein Tco_1513811, partial [Tanacetum coccineum]